MNDFETITTSYQMHDLHLFVLLKENFLFASCARPRSHEHFACQRHRVHSVSGLLHESGDQECDCCGSQHLHQLHQCGPHSDLSQTPGMTLLQSHAKVQKVHAD